MEDNMLYDCVVCGGSIFCDEVWEHPCMNDVSNILLMDGSTIIYPQLDTGEVLRTDNQLSEYRIKLGIENVPPNAQSTPSAGTSFQIMEEQLIELVKERPALWNYKDCSPRERTNAAKNKLWEEIKLIMDPNAQNEQYSVAALKNKWKNLFDTYKIYILKEKTVSGQAAKKKKPWRFMARMSFLRDTLGFSKRKNNLPHTPIEGMSDDDMESSSASDVKIKKRKIGSTSTEDYLQKVVEAMATPTPPPVINIPQQPVPVEMDEINHFCLALDKKMHRMDKSISDELMLDISKLSYNAMCKQSELRKQ